jgi:hypothetical protein
MLLSEIKPLYESLNTFAKNIDWYQDGQNHHGKFTDQHGDNYTIHLIHNMVQIKSLYPIDKIIYNIQFNLTNDNISDDDSVKTTKKHNGLQIISIVKNESLKLFKQYNISPNMLILSISTLPEHNTPEEVITRKRLYTAIAKSIIKETPLEYYYTDINDMDNTNILITDWEVSKKDVPHIRNIIARKNEKILNKRKLKK